MAGSAPLFTYEDDAFAHCQKECDLVMKGGVTSGVVYPYAILELAKVYRFRSVGGASAGAIAAAFAAAAEYARTVRGDPKGFLRMQAHCEDLPERLGKLFQPYPRFAGLMRFLLTAQSGAFLAPLRGALAAFWLTALLGGLAGGGLLAIAGGGWAGGLLGGLVGVATALVARVVRLVLTDLPQYDFGMCSGMTQPAGDGPGLTDWLHAALQDIAFGDQPNPPCLTFGHLTGKDPLHPVINVRMMTTNLSMGRPHTLPTLPRSAGFQRAAWSRLFPTPVLDHLDRVSTPWPDAPETRAIPAEADLPLIVAVRMSLSFPFLFSAVPMVMPDIQTSKLLRANGVVAPVEARRVLFTDGGISSNFPIHLFDALLPTRPTFALSLDELPRGGDPQGPRILIPQSAGDGVGLPVRPIEGVAQFASGVLGAAKDWQDALLAGMAGQRERIAHVMLSPNEGGLNLTMPRARSEALMRYGHEVGRLFAGGALDFDEHRWRRALVAYEPLERLLPAYQATWTGGFGDWLKGYLTQAKSYRELSAADRRTLHRRLGDFAALDSAFQPPIRRPERKFPRPRGRLRIMPDS